MAYLSSLSIMLFVIPSDKGRRFSGRWMHSEGVSNEGIFCESN